MHTGGRCVLRFEKHPTCRRRQPTACSTMLPIARGLWRPGQQEDLPRAAVPLPKRVRQLRYAVWLGSAGEYQRASAAAAAVALPSTRPRPAPYPPPSPLPSFLPPNVAIVGYARTALTNAQLRERLRPRLQGSDDEVGGRGPGTGVRRRGAGRRCLLCSCIRSTRMLHPSAALAQPARLLTRTPPLFIHARRWAASWSGAPTCRAGTTGPRAGAAWRPRSTRVRRARASAATPAAGCTTWRCRPACTLRSARGSR